MKKEVGEKKVYLSMTRGVYFGEYYHKN